MEDKKGHRSKRNKVKKKNKKTKETNICVGVWIEEENSKNERCVLVTEKEVLKFKACDDSNTNTDTLS